MASPQFMQRIDQLLASGKHPQAEQLLARALPAAPDDLDILGTLSFILLKAGNWVRAEHYARRTLELAPANPQAMANLGAALIELHRAAEAVPLLETAVAAMPGSEIARSHLCGGLGELKRFADSLRVAREGLAITPHSPPLHALAATAASRLGLAEIAYQHIQTAVRLAPGNVPYASALCTSAAYVPSLCDSDLLENARIFAEAIAMRYGPASEIPTTAAAGRPLRIAIVSPDFRCHAVANFIRGFVEFRDSATTWLSLYHTGSQCDEISDWFRTRADSWNHVHGISYVKLAERIRADTPDVAIDLAGHSLNNALPTFHLRVAPTQVTFCGFPGSTGLPGMDFRLTDAHTDSTSAMKPNPHESDGGRHPAYSERLLHLPVSSHCFLPFATLPDVASPPSAAAGHVTFGSLSAPMKLNNGLLALWAKLLAAVPASRLVIRHEQLAHAADRDDLTARAVAAGIPAGRLAVAPPLPGTGKLLDAYSTIDIALDTHPYTGTTTLCEALLMGVPAVTLRGSTTPGRVGAAILTQVGLPDLIASTEGDYIRIAATLAADRPRLETLRATLRGRFQASPLADGPAFARAMERTLRAAHARFADQ